MVVQKFHLNILVFYNIGFLFENREGQESNMCVEFEFY
jgi:hypothetical protein